MTAPTHATAVGSALADPIRRELLAFITRSDTAIGRDAAALAVGIPRATAAFHLERLADAGLLVTEFKRLTGRAGPGAGRPAKLYRAAAEDASISVPARRYDLAAELLGAAIDRAESEGGSPREALDRVSAEHGRDLGARAGGLRELLADTGYEPVEDGEGGLLLANCPFHRVARAHTDTVCGANLAFLSGAVESTEDEGLAARLEPREGSCCVHLVPRDDN